jgi:hypothetical protein
LIWLPKQQPFATTCSEGWSTEAFLSHMDVVVLLSAFRALPTATVERLSRTYFGLIALSFRCCHYLSSDLTTIFHHIRRWLSFIIIRISGRGSDERHRWST